MKNFFIRSLMAAVLILPFSGFGQEQTTSVLFLGNSYTGANDLPEQFRKLAKSGGKTVYVQSYTPGGYRLDQHLKNDHTQGLLSSRDWNYVVLQDQSQQPILNGGGNRNSITEFVRKKIKTPQNGSEGVVYMTWGRDEGNAWLKQMDMTYEEMAQRYIDHYTNIGKNLPVRISPVAVAFRKAKAEGFSVYAADGSHPSNTGTYLAACVFYATLFRESPAVDYSSVGDDAQRLQQIASEVVLNNSESRTWNIDRDWFPEGTMGHSNLGTLFPPKKVQPMKPINLEDLSKSAGITQVTVNKKTLCKTYAPSVDATLHFAENGYLDNRYLYTASLTKGFTHEIEITAYKPASYKNTPVVQVYIDFNNNGLFDDSEKVLLDDVTFGTTTAKAQFVAPPTAVEGKLLHMRVMVGGESGKELPITFATQYKGETEDYSVLIQPQPTIVFNTFTSFCDGEPVDLRTKTEAETPLQFRILEGADYARLDGYNFHPIKAGDVKIQAYNDKGDSYIQTVTVAKKIPEIKFPQETTASITKGTIPLYALTNSDGSISYEVITGKDVVSVEGSTLKLLKTGKAIVVAILEGSDCYLPNAAAMNIEVTPPLEETEITDFEDITLSCTDEPVALNPKTNSDGDLKLTVVSGAGIVSVQGGKLKAYKSGKAKVKAFVDATDKHIDAEKIIDVTVTGVTSSIDFGDVPETIYVGDIIDFAPKTIHGDRAFVKTDRASGLLISRYNNKIKALKPGTVTLTAYHHGDGCIEATEDVFELKIVEESIVFNDFSLNCDSDAVDLSEKVTADKPVMFRIVEGKEFVTLNGSELHPVAGGVATVEAYGSGNTMARAKVTVKKYGTQITATSRISAKTTDPKKELTFDTNSDGTATFEILDGDDIVSVENGNLNFLRPGVANVRLNIGETGCYKSAQHIFTVEVTAETALIDGLKDLELSCAGDPVELTPQTNSDGAMTLEVAEGTEVLRLEGKKVIPEKAGTAKIKVSVASTDKYGKAEKTISVTVAPVASGIVFGEIPDKIYTGKTAPLDVRTIHGEKATLSLGSGSEKVAEITANLFKAIGPGNVNIVARHPGDGCVQPAEAVKTVQVLKVSLLGIEDESVAAVPNPFGDRLTVNLSEHSGNLTASVHALDGKEILTATFRNAPYRINTADLRPGTYILVIKGKGTNKSFRIVKR
ncbi:hypothetical protein FUAX_05210 [Fulvitalea axinellae]|uniref:GEVED domain-containing protein n=1 Tax=Fulvitalea axinellae TaxID=1182444 RepID=A0AAU9D0X4_9BACT|nr:hypothetical protein FUAX_05210 [Fulvitalea axinellae]